MFRLRKLIAAVLTAVALFAGAGTATHAHAGSHHTTTRVYYVYYRANPHYQWTYFGGYYDVRQAQYVAYYFRYYGYEAFVY